MMVRCHLSSLTERNTSLAIEHVQETQLLDLDLPGVRDVAQIVRYLPGIGAALCLFLASTEDEKKFQKMVSVSP